jgi:hypothetical protein
LDASGAVATVSLVNDDPFNVDLSWEAAPLAGILTSRLLNLGSDGLA